MISLSAVFCAGNSTANVATSALRAASGSGALTVRGRTVAVVAHEPDLSRVAAALLAGDPERAAAYAFKKSGLLALRLRRAGAELRYLLTPGVLRRLL
jgi:phosphohistidine phosphatase SixA